MISSMTGFGKSELIQENKTITIEIRTLNSKTIDVNSRLPHRYKELDIISAKVPIFKKKYGKEKISLMISLCLLYTSPSPRDTIRSRMPSSA